MRTKKDICIDGVPGRPELAASRPTFTFGLATSRSMSTITGIYFRPCPGGDVDEFKVNRIHANEKRHTCKRNRSKR